MSFPEVLCELMDANGISNVSLGKALGVSDMAVARWKKGDACPSLDNAIGVAKYFGISLDTLVGDNFYVESDNQVRLPVIGTVSVLEVLHETLWAIRYITVEKSLLCGYPREECFALVVRDETIPGCHPGISYIIFHQQRQCANDEYVIVEDKKSKEMSYSQFCWEKDRICLICPNKEFKPIIFPRQEVNRLDVLAVQISVYEE